MCPHVYPSLSSGEPNTLVFALIDLTKSLISLESFSK